jgi:hypothetical protein
LKGSDKTHAGLLVSGGKNAKHGDGGQRPANGGLLPSVRPLTRRQLGTNGRVNQKAEACFRRLPVGICENEIVSNDLRHCGTAPWRVHAATI